MPDGADIKLPSIVVVSREDGRCVFEVWVQGLGSALVLANRNVLESRADAMEIVCRLNGSAPVLVIDREIEGWA